MLKSFFLCLIFAAAAVHAESRVWTSKDGTATLTATFQKADANQVTVVLTNGRAQVLKKESLSAADLQWLEQNGALSSSGAKPPATGKIAIALAGHLIDARGKPADLAKAPGSDPEFYLFYYSASWCGYCVQFTPDVVRFAKQLKPSRFSVVLVPADRSLEDQIAYMKDYRMPWPGLKWNEKGSYPGIPRNPNGGGIPAAVLTDAEGRILTTTRQFDKRADFLETAKKIVLGKSTATASN